MLTVDPHQALLTSLLNTLKQSGVFKSVLPWSYHTFDFNYRGHKIVVESPFCKCELPDGNAVRVEIARITGLEGPYQVFIDILTSEPNGTTLLRKDHIGIVPDFEKIAGLVKEVVAAYEATRPKEVMGDHFFL